MTADQLAALVATHPKFNPRIDTIQCESCFHRFTLWFDHDTLRYEVARPIGRIIITAACDDCAERIRRHDEQQQPRARPGREDRPNHVDFSASAYIG